MTVILIFIRMRFLHYAYASVEMTYILVSYKPYVVISRLRSK